MEVVGKLRLGPAEIVGSNGYTAVGHRKMMRAEGEFERHQLPAGIWRCVCVGGGGWSPQAETLQREEREKRGGPGSEEPRDAGGIRRHGGNRKVGRKILRESRWPQVQESAVSRGECSTA